MDNENYSLSAKLHIENLNLVIKNLCNVFVCYMSKNNRW